jgi:F0F1-type ATP synthase assembly protein I
VRVGDAPADAADAGRSPGAGPRSARVSIAAWLAIRRTMFEGVFAVVFIIWALYWLTVHVTGGWIYVLALVTMFALAIYRIRRTARLGGRPRLYETTR